MKSNVLDYSGMQHSDLKLCSLNGMRFTHFKAKINHSNYIAWLFCMIAEMEESGPTRAVLGPGQTKHSSSDLTLASLFFSIELFYPLFKPSHLPCKNKITQHKSHTEGANMIAKGESGKGQCKEWGTLKKRAQRDFRTSSKQPLLLLSLFIPVVLSHKVGDC